MDGWTDHLHWRFLGEHVLVFGLRLDSAWSFFVASCLTAVICFSERVLTYAVSKKWNPFNPRGRRGSRFGTALWRTCLYWLVTFDRLLYMLIGMTFSFGLIVVAVTCLAIGQFVIEYLEKPLLRDSLEDQYSLESSSSSYPPAPSARTNPATRPRSKSKPESIFIHPNHSNLARADAAAAELGLAGDTELVKTNVYPADEDPWEHGKGKDLARELLGR
ncbi:uncharacterized protein TRAVEDRAFT_111620 [Trametes versicolor FP-101664 SS1]|uniref:uncharacterized protein n=1 Tax=Trametes versicolor (strain FP-101664) TaxID=717944 RepID=UPI0004621C66|nr:uncharacterized protein TRAVEDRAFT_111620 [Trametes versicolor FP-101664 SS1]EIW64467.1 hypothetical protein TRAVEDRAFT_111620 [Trametes versicolor FP-101664 SS1]